MAVHAAVLQLLIMAQGIHVEVLHAALLDLYVIPDLVVGFDETVGKIRIDPVLDNLP